MISYLNGKIVETGLEKDVFHVVIDVHGVGYDVLLSKSSESFLEPGQQVSLFVKESVTAYDGATTLYGFLRKEERNFFLRIREKVDGMGPKKALDCMDKINKSLPDFKRAIIDEDQRLLVSVFGFTKKTAEKLIFALKDQAGSWLVPGAPKWAELPARSSESEAVSGLVNLGYRDEEARETVQKVRLKLGGNPKTELILQVALKELGGRISIG